MHQLFGQLDYRRRLSFSAILTVQVVWLQVRADVRAALKADEPIPELAKPLTVPITVDDHKQTITSALMFHFRRFESPLRHTTNLWPFVYLWHFFTPLEEQRRTVLGDRREPGVDLWSQP